MPPGERYRARGKLQRSPSSSPLSCSDVFRMQDLMDSSRIEKKPKIIPRLSLEMQCHEEPGRHTSK
jgi:hypothetical protein